MDVGVAGSDYKVVTDGGYIFEVQKLDVETIFGEGETGRQPGQLQRCQLLQN